MIAAEVIRAGANPQLVTGNIAITNAIKERGLVLHTPDYSATVEARAVTTLSDLAAQPLFDSAWLVMKANGVVDAARATLPWLAPTAPVVIFQNGLVMEQAIERGQRSARAANLVELLSSL